MITAKQAKKLNKKYVEGTKKSVKHFIKLLNEDIKTRAAAGQTCVYWTIYIDDNVNVLHYAFGGMLIELFPVPFDCYKETFKRMGFKCSLIPPINPINKDYRIKISWEE